MKLLLPIFAMVLGVLFSVQIVHAATTLKVTKIGGTTTPTTFSTFSYAGVNPKFEGTASPSASVQVSISGASSTITATSTGAWSYTPTVLNQVGQYPVVVSSEEQNVSFNLSITATSSAATTSKGGTATTAAELPQSGSVDTTMGLIMLGGVFIMTGLSARFVLPAFVERE